MEPRWTCVHKPSQRLPARMQHLPSYAGFGCAVHFNLLHLLITVHSILFLVLCCSPSHLAFLFSIVGGVPSPCPSRVGRSLCSHVIFLTTALSSSVVSSLTPVAEASKTSLPSSGRLLPMFALELRLIIVHWRITSSIFSNVPTSLVNITYHSSQISYPLHSRRTLVGNWPPHQKISTRREYLDAAS